MASQSQFILTAFAALLAPAVWWGAAMAQEQDSMSPCRMSEAGRALDFWIGHWNVTNGADEFYGINRIEWDAGGCAVHEYWENREGHRGTSLFYFAVNEDTWHQVWVTENTGLPWGLKHKDLFEHFENGAVRFQGELTDQEGNPFLDRTTLTPNDDGTVRQLIEVSMDDGETWRTSFDAIYERKED